MPASRAAARYSPTGTPPWNNPGTSTRPAPRMTGVARRNENRAASSWRNPASKPPPIVTPDREMPGRNVRAREQRLDAALEKDAEHRRRDGADKEKHCEALGVGLHLAADRCREETADDGHPLRAIQNKKSGRGAQVEQHEERQ